MKKFLIVKKFFLGPNFTYLLFRLLNPRFFFLLVRLIAGIIYKLIYLRLLRFTVHLGVIKSLRFKGRTSVIKIRHQIKSIEIATDYFQHICFKSLRIDESNKIPIKVDIASGSVPWTDKFINLEFEDDEDFFSIHRFVWLLKSLKEGISTSKIEWTARQIMSWCSKFKTINDSRVFEPYSISERLVSWCFIIIFIGQYIKVEKFWNELRRSFEFQLSILIKNLEYHGQFTNNHILNNAKCLYICGRLLKLDDVENLGREIVYSEFKEIIQDGVYQEGSSHYQLLLTKSFFEMRFVAEMTNDLKFEKWLTNKIHKMRRICEILLSKYPAKEYPFFGDISPDVEPAWMIGFPFSYLNHQPSPWQKLFNISIPELSNIADLEVLNKSNTEFIKLDFSIWEVWINIKKKGVLCHGHNDNGQVVIFKQGKPVLVDIGRSRYSEHIKSDIGNQLDPSFHNTPRLESCPVEYHKSQGIAEFLATKAVINSRSENSLIFDIVYYSGKIVRREISVDQSKGVKIVDRLMKGDSSEILISTWHFATSVVIKTNLDSANLFEFKDCARVEVRNMNGNNDVKLDPVFRSTSYGSKVPAIALTVESVISPTKAFDMIIN
jgi:hypothetical protein